MNVTFATPRIRAFASKPSRGEAARRADQHTSTRAAHEVRTFKGRVPSKGIPSLRHVKPTAGGRECRWFLDDDARRDWRSRPLLEPLGLVLAVSQKHRLSA